MSNPFDPFNTFDPFGPYGPGDPMMVDPFLHDEPFGGGHWGYSDPFAPPDIFTPNSWQEPYMELYPDPVAQMYEPVYVDLQPPEYVDIYAPLLDEIALEQQGPGWSMGQEEIFEMWEEWVDLQAELETETTSLDRLEMEIEDTTEGATEDNMEEGSHDNETLPAPGIEPGEAEEKEEKPVAFTPEPGPEVETRSRSTYYREPKVREWRPRPPKGIRGSSRRRRSKKKKTKKSEEEVRLCPMTYEIVSLNECKTCEFYKEGECTWEPEEGQGEGQTQGDTE